MDRKLYGTRGITLFFAALTIALTGCGSSETSDALHSLSTREVKLPDGQIIQAEVAVQQEDLIRGLKYRESLAPDKGMVFIHDRAGNYPYWMFECKISLDMIWMDHARRIVEIEANVPPCLGAAETCPSYGGHDEAMYVLELAAGQAAKHGLRKGQTLDF
jgi:uncharacterized membrane protein (UPF0127 family)